MTAPSARRSLTPWRSRAAHAAVVGWGVAASLAFAVSLPSAYRAVSTVCSAAVCPPASFDAAAAARVRELGIPLDVWALVAIGSITVFALTCAAVGAMLLGAVRSTSGRGHDTAFATAALLFALIVAFPQTLESLATELPALRPAVEVFTSLSLVAFVAWIMTLPEGRLRSSSSVVILISATAYAAMVPIAPALGIPGLAVALGGLTVFAAVAWDVVLRFRERRRSRRRDVPPLGMELPIAVVALVTLAAAGVVQGTAVPRGSLGDIVLQVLLSLVFLALPIGLGASLLRRGIPDGRGSLAAVLVGGVSTGLLLSLFVVGYLAVVAAGADPAFAAVLAAAIVALAAAPVVVGVRGLVRRVARSPRDSARALHDISARLTRVSDPDTVPDAAAAAIVEVFGFADAWIESAERSTPEGAVPVPINHGTTTYATLVVMPRPLQDLAGERERDGLAALAAYLGAVFAAAAREADLRAAHAELILARDAERTSLRDELHDELGPLLGSVVLRLRAAENLVEPSSRALIDGSRRDVTSAVAAIRRIAYGLRPPALDEDGLATAIEIFGRGLSSAGFAVTVRDETSGEPLPSTHQLAVYRIALEAMVNALTHSGGTGCVVVMHRERGDFVVDIEDDGSGGSDAELDPGIGVLSMRERARQVRGTVEHAATAGGGTRVRVRIPGPRTDAGSP
ncbi:sensor histidine kinase [Agromyces larvae]|uniref:histidine kinase n=1 Tax=Agromyces larvae TaxID=2929802 RepID=A0ABY4C6I3_9MICO|nr:ATP-binding protein [Agromyces larvae]UOE45796.1 histidine kinase [Agromyces larvae]